MKFLILGSGELGKELTISLKRYGHYVVAADNYAGAPAMQVADECRVFSMLDGSALDAVVAEVRPDFIVPEVEAIRTECLYAFEEQGYHVVPSAKAANLTMNRKAIRDLAAQKLNIRTANYRYAKTLEEFVVAVEEIGFPCVAKPLMSSSGKGQSTVHHSGDVNKAWQYAIQGTRGDVLEVIVEEFIEFESEITLLTITQKNGVTLWCPPIGHRQERGDYQESWMPHIVKPELLAEARRMAKAITDELTGSGIWGVEFFLTSSQVYFSELSPRPHDTGMVTLAGCTPLNEFELHARAILGYPISEQYLVRPAASAVLLASRENATAPPVKGLESALNNPKVDVRIFGKPDTRKFRRMGVVVAWDSESVDAARDLANSAAKKVDVG